mgnify:CR=1 FL=1
MLCVFGLVYQQSTNIGVIHAATNTMRQIPAFRNIQKGTEPLKKHTFLLGAILATALAAPAAIAQSTTTQPESRGHELACTAATAGGAVAGVALGSLLGGGLGRTLFMTAGGVAGGMAGHAMHCPQK